jgi:RNA polymerase sigma-70 factor (ECF subfamily)
MDAIGLDNEGDIGGGDVEMRRIQAARTGDLQAFNDLIIPYQDGLFRWVYRMVGEQALAEDLTQSVFITAYEKLNTFRDGSFRGWLSRIARNRSIDEIRRRNSQRTISLNTAYYRNDGQELQDTLQSETLMPETTVEQKEQARAVRKVLDWLPEEYRQVLVLVDMDEMDYQEAADILGVPLGTIKSRVARARGKFRELAMESGILST